MTIGPSITWAPSPRVLTYFNYLVGPEQRDKESNYRHLIDLGLGVNPIEPLNICFSADVGYEQNAIGGSENAWWWGMFAVARYKVTDAFEPALRLEIYDDEQGFTTGVAQTVGELTLTLNYRVDLPGETHVLVRPEYRYDVSDANFFSSDQQFWDRRHQHTVGLGAVFYF